MTNTFRLADALVTYGVLRYADLCGQTPGLTSMTADVANRLAAELLQSTMILDKISNDPG
jgi:hypothetical protein